MKIWVIGVAAIALGGAMALQFVGVRDVKEGDRVTDATAVDLAVRIPTFLPEWSGKDEPLGPTEFSSQAVKKVLNCDDYVYRVFRRGDVTLGVYVAYWSPGRMPIQKVASHTPDRCWTENGWSCLEMRFNENIESGPVMLRGGQWRSFQPPETAGIREYAVYWHLVGSKLYDYGARFNAKPHPLQWWRDTLRYAFSGSEEQYFIRVTSNRDFSMLRGDPAWEMLLDSIGKLGVSRATAH